MSIEQIVTRRKKLFNTIGYFCEKENIYFLSTDVMKIRGQTIDEFDHDT